MSGLTTGTIEVRRLVKLFGPDPASVMPLVRDGIGKAELQSVHGHVLGLRDVNLSIPDGSVQVIMGLSGSGKSTLVRHFNRLIDPTDGEVSIGGVDVLGLGREQLRRFRQSWISMVFQRFALFPHKTVLANVAYGLDVQGAKGRERDDKVAYWIERVGLDGYEDSYPNQLSGGMQQRVGLARALATDPKILLMDEPFSALDPLIRADMQALILDLQAELKKTVVFVTHDLDEAIAIGDRIAILRDGEVIQNADSQRVVLHPADDYIEAFTRKINRGRVLRVESVMEPARPDLDSPLQCSADMALEDALPLVSASPGEEAPVVDATGAVVGAISVLRILVAMAGGRFSVGDGAKDRFASKTQ